MTQQITKDLLPTYKQVVCNLEKEQEKSKKYFAENKILRKEKSRAKARIKFLVDSRDKIREKNTIKSVEIKVLRTKLKPKRHHYTSLMIKLSVMLRVFTNSSFRSISMILTLLKDYLYLEDLVVPCANTIQNWTSN